MRQFKVRQKLGLVNREQFFYRFQFQNHFVLHKEINSVTTIQLQAFVSDREVHLPLKAQSPKLKLVAKALLVGRLQKTWSEMAMNLQRRAENGTRPRVPRFLPGLDMKNGCLGSPDHLITESVGQGHKPGDSRGLCPITARGR